MPDPDEDTPCRFSAHPGLPPYWVAWLRHLHRQALTQGEEAKAAVLARLAASEAAALAVRSGAMRQGGTVKFANELGKRRHRRDQATTEYLRPTRRVFVSRDRASRRELRGLFRLPGGNHLRAALHDEGCLRVHLAVGLLERLASLAAQPLNHALLEARKLLTKYRAWCDEARRLRKHGKDEQADQLARMAIVYAKRAETEMAQAEQGAPFATEEEREDYLIAETMFQLQWCFGFAGHRVAAGLVSAALGRQISPRRSLRGRRTPHV